MSKSAKVVLARTHESGCAKPLADVRFAPRVRPVPTEQGRTLESLSGAYPYRKTRYPLFGICADPTVYWPIAVWSILATTGEGRLSGLPARPKAASSGD